MSRIFETSVSAVYPLYRRKVERKGRRKEELDAVICWLAGVEQAGLEADLAAGTSLRNLFAAHPLNANATLITGSVCGVRVEDVTDPLMQKIRYLDKLVDELAQGRELERALRH